MAKTDYKIELRDGLSWRTFNHGSDDGYGQQIRIAMENLKRSYPQRSVRAVNAKTGALLDMLP
jgi:hypothetical protein